MAQPFIDCAIKLKDKIHNIENIDKIIASVGEGTVHRLWEPLKEKQKPSTPYGAKFSVPYCISIGLINGSAGLNEFTDKHLKKLEVIKLASKVNYEINPDDEYPRNYTGKINVIMKDGTIYTSSQECLRGGKRDPLSQNEVKEKFEANLKFANIKSNEIDKLYNFLKNIFKSKNLNFLNEINF